MTELEALKKRHSVRNYLAKDIEQEKIDLLNKLIEECNNEGNLHFQLCVDAKNTYNRLLNKAMGLGSAPSVIACVGHDDDTLEERIGYFGQKIVLYAQQLGLNTCWAGTFNKKNMPAVVANGEKLVISIAIGYGATQGKERKTKSFEQVATGIDMRPDWFVKGIEAALMAPTALNQQKFEIVLEADETVTFKDKGGAYSKVDLGIVKYNFEVGANFVKNSD